MEDVIIRLLKTKDDWEQFIEMTRVNFPEYIEKVIKEGMEYHQQKDNFLFGKFIKEKILGTIGIRIVSTRNLGIIGYLQVKKDFREQGIAKELYNKILEVARNYNCSFLYLAVYAKNNHANSIYKHWGFKNVPMVYNIKSNLKKRHTSEKLKSKRMIINKQKSVDKLINKLYYEYNFLNKIEHFFEKMHYRFLKKCLYTRRVNRNDYIVVITGEYEQIEVYLILLMKRGEKMIETLKEEIYEIGSTEKTIKRKISLFGELNQKEIDELIILGLEFDVPIETKGYLLEL